MYLHNRIGADVARTKTTPLAMYISDYLDACEAGSGMTRPLSPYTIIGYRKALTHLNALMGEPALTGFTEEAVGRVITNKRKTSKSHAAAMARVAKAFSSWLERRKWTDENRLEDLGVPTFNGRRRSFSDIEMRTIVSALHELPNRTRRRDRAVVLLAIGSGLRSNEIRTLAIGDVHTAKPLSESWAHIRWDVTKSQKERMVRIAEDAAQAIKEYIAADRPETEPSKSLFLSEEGREYSYEGWQKMFYRIAQRLEEFGVKDFGAHRCRHEWATLGVRAGMTQAQLAQEGGWKRGSKIPAQYIDEIPFAEIQRQPSPMTTFLRRVS